MRIVTQLAVVAVLVAAGTGGWVAWNQRDGAQPAAVGPAAGGPGGRGPGGGAGLAVPVETIIVRAGIVVDRVESVGTAKANESINVTAKQTGTIQAIRFEDGQRVRAGQVLVELEAAERRADLDQARADLDQARAQRDEIRNQLERSRQLQRTGNVPEARMDQLDAQLRAAENRVRSVEARVKAVDSRLDDQRISAPFEGRVGMRNVSSGALVQPGTLITTLDDIGRIKIDFAVPETALGRLKNGLVVQAKTAAYPGKIFEGTVSSIDTRVDPATRSVRVNAMFDNKEELLKPGLFLNVELTVAQRDNAVLLPEEALVPEGSKQFVFVVRDNRAERREVTLGQRLPGEVEILEGLKPGEVVIARGVQKVRHNQPVNARPLRPTT